MKNRLGKTNLIVKKLGFGGIPIQRTNQNEVFKIVDELINQGINFIDTARGYTVSEEYIGEAIKGRRDKFILATKSMARTYEAMKKDIEISLSNLKTNYIDIYQLHNVKNKDELDVILGDGGAYLALKEALEDGKIGHIGITSHSLDFLKSLVNSDDFLFSTIQFPFNIIESEASDLFKKAKEKDIGTIVMKPLGGGAILNKKLAIKYLLNQDCVDCIIPGMGSAIEVIENSSVENEKLNDLEILEIEKIKKELGNDFCRRCGYCLPCTKGIDIPSSFMFLGYFKRYGLKDWAEERYNNLPHKASECIECKKCMKKCPYNLDIIKKLKETVEVFGK